MSLLKNDCAVIVPWVREEQIELFLNQWGAKCNHSNPHEWLVLMRDTQKKGCGAMKNEGVIEAVRRGAKIVVILDDDCFPHVADGFDSDADGPRSLVGLAWEHVLALEPQSVEMYQSVTKPSSRGTPYFIENRSMQMPVAASMGFWTENGDYCAVRQLIDGEQNMKFQRKAVFGRYFPLCGMNLAFRPQLWDPWCRFIDVARFDDIWMGWLFQKEATRRNHCFNLNGPLVRHSRQSNVWKNLVHEAPNLEASETLWREIAASPEREYEALIELLPKSTRPSAHL